MFYSLTRIISPRNSIVRVATRFLSEHTSITREKRIDEQLDYLKSIIEDKTEDWTVVKKDVLSKQGNLNQKNVDAVMLKYMISLKNYNAALSFAEHVTSSTEELSLGTINALLSLYYEIGKKDKLSKEQTKFILDVHKSLHDKYKFLEYFTCERLLHALCVIDEWEKALKVLDEIHLSTVPTHSAYSTLIATFFKLNKKKKALELVNESLKYKRPLLENAYEAWLNYILRKYKDKKVIAKHLDEVFSFIARHCAIIPMNTANKFKELYDSMDWDAQFTRIRKVDGQCLCCKDKLDCLSLADEEFTLLQQNVKEKLIVGSDLFLKTSPEELKRFSDFVEKTAPYDIVLDGLNIAYTAGAGSNMDKAKLLNNVVEHFLRQNKKILLLGREHMMRWNKRIMQQIMNNTSFFLTDNLSQDDPYFITAAILSGPQTDIVSKDLLRGHKFLLKEENLRQIFKRWQWQHQWMVFPSKHKAPVQPPLQFTPCAQKKNNTWHLPFEREVLTAASQINDGTPDLFSWICLRQTEQYFLALSEAGGLGLAGSTNRKEVAVKQKELRQRQTWLVNFSAQVAYRLCDYISKGQKEMLVSNRLRSIADVVLERVADILGEPKPTRTNPGRLARFMVAVSDRIAVWIENVVYRADASEPLGITKGPDEHIQLDAESPLKC